MRNILTLLMTLVFSAGLMAQSQMISGTLTDASTNETLPGVNIIVKGKTIGTLTDIDGKFELEVPKEDNILMFSFVGYVTQEVEIGDSKTINVALESDYQNLDEVVVVGYGTKRKSLVTGAISKVEAEDLKSISATRADAAIQGRTAGVSILPTSGSPGAATQIRIRGVNSNGDSNPLFIVDGMKTGDINNVDPSDIASIEVLKDAASAAIYGTEGANGVVLITTKSGKAGVTKINYDYQFGIQSARTDMELMNADQYTSWMTEAGLEVSDTYGADTDWLDEIFEAAPMQKHYLNISGGNEKTTYMLSGSYLDQDGIVGGEQSNYTRYTTRLNVKSDVKDWLEVGANVSYSHSDQKYIDQDNEYRSVVNSALLMDPLTPVTYDGTPDRVQGLLDEGYTILQNGDGDYYGLAENVTGEMANPVALLDTYHNNITQDKFLSNAYATLKPIEGLKITSRIGMDLTYQINHSWSPLYYFSTESQNTSMTVSDEINKWDTWLWENYATYETSVDDHNMTFLAGFSNEKYEGPYYGMSSGNMIYASDYFAYHSYVNSDDYDLVDGYMSESTTTSYFGRFSYDYQNKYMFEASVRRDGSDAFPDDNQFATFPAVSAGWVFSEEDFYTFGGIMDYAKLRASWGQNGSKANIPGNQDIELWEFGGIQYPDADGNFVSGAQIANLVNTDLKWETTEMTDIGLDLRFFNSKLTFSADYFYKQTKDLITYATGPLSVGNDFPYANVGTVTNKGFDLELGYRNRDHKLKYSFNVNASFIDNEVTELSVDAPVSGANVRGYDLTWFEEGQPIWYFKGYKTDGLDENGDVNVVDVNGDGEITAEDQTYIGDPHADVYFGGNISAQYENFDFNLFFQGSYGNDIFMAWYRTDRQYSNKPSYFYTDDDFPNADNSSDYIYRSDLMVSDGSYLRVKQIQLGYTIDKGITDKIGVNSLRAYVSLENFFTITNYKGLDPEAGSTNNTSQGVDRGIYPSAGIFLMGVNISL